MSTILQPGDMIMVRKDIDSNSPLMFGFNSKMESYRGSYVTIAHSRVILRKDPENPESYRYKIWEDNVTWNWHISMFVPDTVVRKETIFFERVSPEQVLQAYRITGYSPRFEPYLSSPYVGSSDPFTTIVHTIAGKERKFEDVKKIIFNIWPYNYVRDFLAGWSNRHLPPLGTIEYYKDGQNARREFRQEVDF